MPWPIANRADSLEIDFYYLRRQIGGYLGFGINHADWNDETEQTVQEVIDEGLRSYYFPPPLQPPYTIVEGDVHEWSFMRPTWEFTTEADERRYALPSTFDRPIGDLVYLDTDNAFPTAKHASPSRLLALEARTSFTSPPEYFAIEPMDSAGTEKQTLILVLHPTPDAQYRMALRYQAHAQRLTEDAPFPLGGQVHGPGILASCMAVAELRKIGMQGPLFQVFMQKLAGNIVRDRQRNAHVLGYNGNLALDTFGRSKLRRLNGIFYNDATYSNTSYSGQ